MHLYVGLGAGRYHNCENGLSHRNLMIARIVYITFTTPSFTCITTLDTTALQSHYNTVSLDTTVLQCHYNTVSLDTTTLQCKYNTVPALHHGTANATQLGTLATDR